MGAGTVGRHRHSGPFELLSKAYRPVPHAQHRLASPLAARRQAPGEVGGADRDRLHDAAAVAIERGEHLAAAARRSRPGRRGGRAPPRRARAPRGWRRRPAGRSWACASARAVAMPSRSPVKPPGPMPTQIRSTSSQPPPASASTCLEQRLQRLGVARRAVGIVAALELAVRGDDGDRGRARRGVEADDHSTSIRRPSPPACASRTRCLTRSPGQASSACSGHSTKTIASSAKNGSSRPGSSPAIPASR